MQYLSLFSLFPSPLLEIKFPAHFRSPGIRKVETEYVETSHRGYRGSHNEHFRYCTIIPAAMTGLSFSIPTKIVYAIPGY